MRRLSPDRGRRALRTTGLALIGSVALLAASTAGATVPVVQTPTSSTSNWPGYLDGPAHTSYNSTATAITTSNASSLVRAWTWMPDPPPIPGLGEAITSSPTVYNGVIYLGANNGSFYAISEATGTVIWRHFIGYVTANTPTCGARGFISTATVAKDPSTGRLTVYVAAPDGYLYAMAASTGATVWRSVVGIPTPGENDYFNWSSPAVTDGEVYVGISSQCDDPLVRGGALAFKQTTGARTGAYYNVPAGDIGGSVWSSPSVAPDGDVFITTGNGPVSNPSLGTSVSIVALHGVTLSLLGSWQVPTAQQDGTDSDFGGSSTLFSAELPGSSAGRPGSSDEPTPMVGVCNKSGLYYAFEQADVSDGPVWQDKIGNGGCIAPAAFDGSHLWLGGTTTTLGGSTVDGTVRQVDPATGAVEWATAVPGHVLAGPTVDGAGVIAVATYAPTPGATNGVYLLNDATGVLLASLDNGDSPEFSQPVFADHHIFTASLTGGLRAFVP